MDQPVLHCRLCDYKLDLHPSLLDGKEADGRDDEPVLSELDNRLREGIGLAESGNLLELICSSNSPLQLPMCKVCSTKVSAELNKQLSDLESECVSYKAALEQLVQRRAEPFDKETAKQKLERLQAEEDELLEQLAGLEDEERILNQELDNKLEERRVVTEKDSQLYKQLRDNHRTLIEQAEEQRSLKAQLKFTNEQIQRLVRVNVLDMTFFIWKVPSDIKFYFNTHKSTGERRLQDGDYGTINGFRLGRLRHELVEWNEINAAFGQITFLLVVMAEKLNMKFSGYEVGFATFHKRTIFPCASHSFIRAHRPNGKPEDLPLYGGGGWRPFGQPALDQAIVAYVECFCQLETRLKAVQNYPAATQILPYRMIKEKIVDKDSQYLVKMQLNSEERWTKAMKCLLLNLKRVVGILANVRPSSSPSVQTQQQAPEGAPLTNQADSGRNN